MAKLDENVTIYACDTPECCTERVARSDEIPEGFIGTTTFEYAGGGDTVEWFACIASHIRKAVVAVQLAGLSTNPALPKVKDTTPDPAVSVASNDKD